jgi:hypothetical protein
VSISHLIVDSYSLRKLTVPFNACVSYLYDSLVFSRSERTLRINSPRQSTEYMAGSVLACGIQV